MKFDTYRLLRCATMTLLITGGLYAKPPNENQILYLMQARQTQRAITQYQSLAKSQGKHSFDLLEQMAQIVLIQGAGSKKPEEQLLSIYGADIAGYTGATEIYEIAMKSREPQAQMAAIQFVGKMQDDRAEEVLRNAFSSDFFIIRMEAAYQLAQRKSPVALGLIESLMYKLPREFWVYFPELYAMLGTSDATYTLKRLVQDGWVHIRLASYLAAARFGRDDFLGTIRSGLTHLNEGEQEAAAAALGWLHDSHSIEALESRMKSQNPHIRLAAALALVHLGKQEYRTVVFEAARAKNPFAIFALGQINESEDLLARMIFDSDRQVKINASLALLERRDLRSLVPLEEILFPDERDLGYHPGYSPGHSMLAWKVVPSATAYSKTTHRDVVSITRSLREQVLTKVLALGDDPFLKVAKRLLSGRERALIPLVIAMLENMATPEAIALLKAHSRSVGAPFVRAYCALALYRMKVPGPYEKLVIDWVKEHQNTELIRVPSSGAVDVAARGLSSRTDA